MTPRELKMTLERNAPIGTVFDNPGGGTSTIIGYGDEKLSYLRRNSTIYVAYADLVSAYSEFRGKRVAAPQLKKFAPRVFDSSARPAGHSCNCTMLFILFRRIGLAGAIEGGGVRGNPYAARLENESDV